MKIQLSNNVRKYKRAKTRSTLTKSILQLYLNKELSFIQVRVRMNSSLIYLIHVEY